MTITNIPVIGYPDYTPYTQITPFTVRDGATYLLVLEGLRDWIRDVLIPSIDTNIGGLETAWETQTNALVDEINATIATVTVQVNQAIADDQAAVNQAIADSQAQVNSDIADMQTTLNSAIASIINSTIAVTDPVVTNLVTNTASTTRTTLNGLYAGLPAFNNLVSVTAKSMVLFGDSWEYYNYGDPTSPSRPSYGSRGYATNGNIFLGHAFTFINKGVGGQDTIAMLARAQTDLVGVTAGWALIGSGTNDITNGRTLAQITTNLGQLYDLAQQSGKRVAARTVPPRTGATTAQQLLRAQINSWIRSQATVRKGFVIVDVESALMDPTTNDFVSGYSVDGVHLTNSGGVAAGIAFANAFRTVVTPTPVLLPPAGAQNLLKNNGGSFSGASGAVPTGWTANAWSAGQPVYSKVARTDGIPGQWQQLVVPSDSRGFLRSTVLQLNLGEFNIGDTVRAAVEFQADTMEVAPNPNSQAIYIQLEYFDGTTTYYMSDPEWFTGEQENMGNLPRSGVLVTPWYTIPAGGANQTLAMTIQARCGGVYRFARATLARA